MKRWLGRFLADASWRCLNLVAALFEPYFTDRIEELYKAAMRRTRPEDSE